VKYLSVIIMLSFSCASTPAVPTVQPSDPLGVAENWARNPTQAPAFVSAWSVPGRVARIYRAGEEYKALVVERNSQGAGAGVLLTISKPPDGNWELTSIEESPANHLIPEF